MIKKIIEYLNQPFPDSNSLEDSLKNAVIIGAIVFLVLILFKPFGIEETGDEAWFYSLAFGFITWLVVFLFEWIVLKVLRLERDVKEWTFWKWILEVLILIGFISIGNYLFLILITDQPFNIGGFWIMLISTLKIAIIPTLIIGLYQINKNYRKYVEIATYWHPEKSMVKEETKIEISNSRGELCLELALKDLLYIEAIQNYVGVYFYKNGVVEKELIRNTLKNIEEETEEPVIRCHRSYLVNRNKISKIDGNSQGLTISFQHTENKVPVSRTYIPKFSN